MFKSSSLVHASEFSQNSIASLLQQANTQLSSRLECELLLAHTLNFSRIELYTRKEEMISATNQERFFEFIHRRIAGEPIAYIVGYKEFWSLNLNVNPSVLIPRPETELLVEQLLSRISKTENEIKILELGTGSGAIALALANECPQWSIIATDLSNDALEIAKKNAKDLTLENLTFYCGNWYSALRKHEHYESFQAIVSNPPYIAVNSPYLKKGDLRFEPELALIAGKEGLDSLKQVINGAWDYLRHKAWLLLEHGYDQYDLVRALMQDAGFTQVAHHKDLANVNRVTVGLKP